MIIKKKYTKPKLRTIELVAEEVLAVGCKMFSGIGPGPLMSQCKMPAGGPCHNKGS